MQHTHRVLEPTATNCMLTAAQTKQHSPSTRTRVQHSALTLTAGTVSPRPPFPAYWGLFHQMLFMTSDASVRLTPGATL